ncbi:MAG: Mut7-C RNAse domain-containing protein, partial [Candidatus Methanodesulfokora sp.]
AKWLRILGVSVITDLGEGNFDDLALKVAEERKCVILTRDESLFKRAVKRNIRVEFVPEDPIKALVEISAKYGIQLEIDLDKTRCPLCNTPLRKVGHEEAAGKVPDAVIRSEKQILFCSNCNKYYWTGTHYENMLSELEIARSLKEADDERRRE